MRFVVLFLLFSFVSVHGFAFTCGGEVAQKGLPIAAPQFNGPISMNLNSDANFEMIVDAESESMLIPLNFELGRSGVAAVLIRTSFSETRLAALPKNRCRETPFVTENAYMKIRPETDLEVFLLRNADDQIVKGRQPDRIVSAKEIHDALSSAALLARP